ncbi:hypothetical protein [Rhodococcus opacus]|uniref:hypothetical protein n=1 Tax=Rhodococcus opacus TaxID=37919 RepID=UPI001469BB6D|nr:hypothetical protein [Rhodococcus opacus]MDJ0419617.1 hypothetical protein [Rhodococcus opacus]MDV6244798.1 hypothetical protein [Rhodococcus opacus]MDV7088221.1 hypothetical protein [Rhodococcus opacus]WKN52588.1 hypothetical protein HJ581_0001320 [Rhodococcus opacus]
MTSSGPNPVLAPIRRWVLYSRTNLAITVVSAILGLFIIGMVFGEQKPATNTAKTAATAASSTTSAKVEPISYELTPVRESEVAGKPGYKVAATATATAMAYAHAYVDTTPSDTKWAEVIARYTSTQPGDTLLAARPQTMVAITGPTASELINAEGGTRKAEVTIPTQAGNLRVTLVVEDTTGGEQRWVVDTPLPTLDMSEVAMLAPDTTDRPGPNSSTPTPNTTTPEPTTTTAAPTTTPQASEDTEELPSQKPIPSPAPVPVPGPIPLPELDTPLPGAL